MFFNFKPGDQIRRLVLHRIILNFLTSFRITIINIFIIIIFTISRVIFISHLLFCTSLKFCLFLDTKFVFLSDKTKHARIQPFLL